MHVVRDDDAELVATAYAEGVRDGREVPHGPPLVPWVQWRAAISWALPALALVLGAWLARHVSVNYLPPNSRFPAPVACVTVVTLRRRFPR